MRAPNIIMTNMPSTIGASSISLAAVCESTVKSSSSILSYNLLFGRLAYLPIRAFWAERDKRLWSEKCQTFKMDVLTVVDEKDRHQKCTEELVQEDENGLIEGIAKVFFIHCFLIYKISFPFFK